MLGQPRLLLATGLLEAHCPSDPATYSMHRLIAVGRGSACHAWHQQQETYFFEP